jgi:uncharacterized protein
MMAEAACRTKGRGRPMRRRRIAPRKVQIPREETMKAQSSRPRVLPEVLPETEFYWKSGANGVLSFLRCQDCKFYVHPPKPICPNCYKFNLKPEAVSGKATIGGFTVNSQPWRAGVPLPYVVALVDIVEQKGLRLTTSIINCEIEDISVDMPVRVVFEEAEDVFLPLFEPDPAANNKGGSR